MDISALWSARLLTSSVTVRWTVFWLREDAVLELSQAVCFDKSLTIFVVHVTFQTLMFTQQVFLITFFSAMSVWPLSHFTYWTELSLLDINRMLLRINAKTKFPLCHFTRLLKQSWPIRQHSAWFVAVIIVTGGDRLEWSVEKKKKKKKSNGATVNVRIFLIEQSLFVKWRCVAIYWIKEMFHQVTSRSVDGMLVLLSTVSYKKQKKAITKKTFDFLIRCSFSVFSIKVGLAFRPLKTSSMRP